MAVSTYSCETGSHLIPDAVAVVNIWKDKMDRNWCEYYVMFNQKYKEHVYRSYYVEGYVLEDKQSFGGELSFNDDVVNEILIAIKVKLSSFADSMSNMCDKCYFNLKVERIRLKEASRVNAGMLLRSADLVYILDTVKERKRTETAVLKEIRDIVGVVKNYQEGYHLEFE